jgi:hypothetical protein
MEQNTPIIEEQEKKTRVVIALPGRSYSNNFLVSWTRAMDTLWKLNYEVVIVNRYSSFVTFSRMQTLGLDVRRGPEQKPFNGELEYDIWLTIDSDMVFTPDDLVQLIKSTEIHPVVSGLYQMHDAQHYACITDWDTNYFRENGTFKFITPKEVDDFKNNTGQNFMEVVYNGMGFFACRKGVIEQLKYPYFYRPLEEIKDDNGNVIMKDMCSEDVAFCKNLKDAGFIVYVNTNIRVGHEKNFII